MDKYLAFAKELAYQAGKIIKDNFEKKHEAQMKADATPVTKIDIQINQLALDAIKARFPGHGVLGEEGNLGDGTEKYQWVLDPIDATKAFILGIPNSVFMLALTEDGQNQLAVVYDPFADKLYHAVKDGGAFCNDQPIHVNKQPLKGGIVMLGETSAAVFAKGVEAAGGQVEMVTGTGYKCMLLASGKGVGTYKDKSEGDFHDVGPAALIIEEAGGRATDLDGRPQRYDRQLNGAILSNGTVHADLVKIAQETNQ